MKFKVLAHLPSGSVQHIVVAETAEQARAKVSRAHPKAEMIQVEEVGGAA